MKNPRRRHETTKNNVTRQQTRIFEPTHQAYVPASRTESPTGFFVHYTRTIHSIYS